ncbi:putative mucin TcSMUGS [Trypanosoma cruzi]|uniref:Putative mucin TcSMUGS n=1 Tax=Trypanosoma cruzi TaxID=5693 RepID=A0A2V2X3A7_TRYCR|nr:putative mucin TcSMUGS [Trypanosoma cruzi]
MMLRRVLCVLFLALCCACVCATAQEEGQYDVAVVEAGEGQDQTTTTTTTTTLLLRRPPPPPMHPPRHDHHHQCTRQGHDHHHHQCTRQEHNHLQGTDSWRRERPRRPFVGSGAAAAACQCRCGDRRCCVLRTGRGACAALGVTHREVRRVYLSTLQRCGCIYAIVFGCACLAYLPPFVLRLVLPGVTIFCFGCRCVLAPCRLPVHSLRRPRADVHLLPPPRHLWGEASVRFYFYFYFFFGLCSFVRFRR